MELKDIVNLFFKTSTNQVFVELLSEYDDRMLFHNGYKSDKPLLCKVSQGNRLFDLVRYQDPCNFAVSERVCNLLRDEGITGWDSYAIEIIGKTEKYFGFQVLGKCGKLNRPKEAGFYIGYDFDIKTWDGSDFFTPEGTCLIFCTSKVMGLFQKHKITNVEFTYISDCRAYSVGENS